MEWGLTPDQWRARSVDDRGRMMAHVWLKSTREAYAAEARMPEEKPDPKKGNTTGGMSQFRAMKQAMTPPPGWKPAGS